MKTRVPIALLMFLSTMARAADQSVQHIVRAQTPEGVAVIGYTERPISGTGPTTRQVDDDTNQNVQSQRIQFRLVVMMLPKDGVPQLLWLKPFGSGWVVINNTPKLYQISVQKGYVMVIYSSDTRMLCADIAKPDDWRFTHLAVDMRLKDAGSALHLAKLPPNDDDIDATIIDAADVRDVRLRITIRGNADRNEKPRSLTFQPLFNSNNEWAGWREIPGT